MPDLVLYKFDACPYCRRVATFLDDRGIHVPMRDTRLEEGARDELIRLGGKSQVPCLIVDGEALYESLDIIEWFRENWEE